ncbi:MAG: hypothetical protein ACI9DG_001145 [Oleispira sp.]
MGADHHGRLRVNRDNNILIISASNFFISSALAVLSVAIRMVGIVYDSGLQDLSDGVMRFSMFASHFMIQS